MYNVQESCYSAQQYSISITLLDIDSIWQYIFLPNAISEKLLQTTVETLQLKFVTQLKVLRIQSHTATAKCLLLIVFHTGRNVNI